MVHTVGMLVPYVHRRVDGYALLTSVLKMRGILGEEMCLFNLRIFLSSWEKGEDYGKETRHRKHCCTRKHRMS